jgi:RecB family exonuclease
MLLGNGVAPGLLDRWLYMEYRQAEQGAPLPAAFEVEIAETLMLDDAHIDVQLRVDRIDYDPTSEPARLVVIDYKNSKDSVPSVADVAVGRKLQMPLYVHAVNRACQRSGINATVESAQYIPLGKRLHDADAARRILRLGCDGLGNTDKALKQPFEETMANIDVALVDVVTQLRQASFPVRPRPQACAHCSYNELCRIESFGAG